MKTIKWHLSIGYAGTDQEDEFEVEDDATDEEIEEMAKDAAFDCIDWGWEVKAGATDER
jgi:hypothetical protein